MIINAEQTQSYSLYTKTNLKGEKEWEQTFRGTGFDSACSVQQTDDSGYILAGDTLFETGLCTAWLLKTNSKGEKEWEATFGGTGLDSAYSVQQTTDGGYILAGETLSFYIGLCTAWLVKTNSKGIKEWEKTYGESGLDSAYAVQQTTDGGYIFAGETFSLGAYGWTDAWLVKTDSEGNVEWEKTIGGSGDDLASAVQQTVDGGYVIAGCTDSYGCGDYDSWLIKVGGLSVKKVHNINTREDFATIQDAINDEDTQDGHTIIVDPGTFTENVLVDKSLTIKGVGMPVVESGDGGNVFLVGKDGCTIEGFNVTGARWPYSGVKITSGKSIG